MWLQQGGTQKGPPWPGEVRTVCMNCIVSLSASPRHKALPLAKSTEAVGEINPGGVKKK